MRSRPTTMSLFCGAGGETMGKVLAFEELGIRTKDTTAYALNHWDEAVMTHRQNFPGIECRQESIEEVTAADFGLEGQTINMLWASPSCVHFSTARGGKPVSDQQRSHADEVVERFLKVADVKVLLMENVPEFREWGPLHLDHSAGCKGREPAAKKCPVKACHFEKPIKERKGEYFAVFIEKLKGLGYAVEYRILCAADYGDPTIRRRFFLQAVKDGKKIRWPEPTHRNPKKAAGLFDAALLPWRTAAECIDFSLPCPSIFDRPKPLAPKTLQRIAAGIERFVLQGEPFLVNLTHGGRLEDLAEPFKTITGARRGEKAVVAPCFVGVGGRAGQSEPRGADDPLGTITTKADGALVAASLVRTDMHQSNATCAYSADEPLHTVTTGGGHAVVEASFVVKNYTGVVGHKPDQPLGTVTGVDHHALAAASLIHLRGTSERHVARSAGSVDEPLPTLTGSGAHEALVAASLIQTGYGEREGQAPRVLDLEAPMGTLVAGGTKQALVHALLTNTTGSAPHSPEEPMPALTTGQQQGLVAACLTKFQQNSKGQPVSEPLDTVMAGASRFGVVAAFLQRYGKGDSPQHYTHPLDDPLRTQDTKDRFALVTVMIQGQEYILADIGLRMLQPRELARAMSLPDSFSFNRPDGKPLKKEHQVKMIGNMVPVLTCKALVRTIIEDRREAFGVAAA